MRAGQTLADARAGLPALATCPAEPSADRVALERLALWAGRYGPRRNIHGADGLWIDITGVGHLFGHEEILARDLLDRLAHFGVSASLGLADTFGAAYALARKTTEPCGALAIAPATTTSAAIADLAIEGLRLDTAAVILLKRLGLRRIGDLYDMPRAALEARFRCRGAKSRPAASSARERALAGAVLTRLDQALGRAPEMLPPLAEPPAHMARALFAEPLLSTAGVEQATQRLAQDLASTLADARVGLRRARLRLYRSDGTVATLGLGTSAPCREASHIARLFCERLNAIDAGFGIDAITLEATRTEPVADVQASLPSTLGHTARHLPTALIDRLSNRLGEHRVLRLTPVESHIPERSERRHPAIGEAAWALARPAPESSLERPPVPGPRRQGRRPPLLLARPEPVTVLAEVPEGAPLRFTWRRRHHRIRRADGPERIAPEWWTTLAGPPGASPRREPRTRDYYVLEDESGGRFWIFRDGLYRAGGEERPPAWYIHGLFC